MQRQCENLDYTNKVSNVATVRIRVNNKWHVERAPAVVYPFKLKLFTNVYIGTKQHHYNVQTYDEERL